MPDMADVVNQTEAIVSLSATDGRLLGGLRLEITERICLRVRKRLGKAIEGICWRRDRRRGDADERANLFGQRSRKRCLHNISHRI